MKKSKSKITSSADKNAGKNKIVKNEPTQEDTKASKSSQNGNKISERRRAGKKVNSKSSHNYSTPAIASGLVLFVATMIGVWYNLTVGQHENIGSNTQSTPPIVDGVSGLMSKSLKQSFNLDSARVQAVREHNMKKYGFNYSTTGIDRRINLSLQEFYDVYDGKWPVIIQDVVPTWDAAGWTHESLCKTYHQERIVVKAVQGSIEKGESLAMPLGFFCNHTHIASEQLWTYLEDELFIPMRPWLRKDIGKTVYWDDDLFQLFPSEVRPWDCMLLWGTAYSRSSMHIDPYNWTGTNAVLRGHKHWTLVLPGQDDLMYVFPGKKSEFPLNCYKYNSPIDSFNFDANRYPKFKNAKVIQFDQRPGEVLIIPTGWFHQAFNSEETIAVSSQFVNRNNYRVVLEEILKFGDIQRSNVPSHVSKLGPAEQVKGVMSILPEELLERGRKITKEILHQIKYSSNPPKPSM